MGLGLPPYPWAGRQGMGGTPPQGHPWPFPPGVVCFSAPLDAGYSGFAGVGGLLGAGYCNITDYAASFASPSLPLAVVSARGSSIIAPWQG